MLKELKKDVVDFKNKYLSLKNLSNKQREKLELGAYGALLGGLYSMFTVPLAALYTGIVTEDLGIDNAGMPELVALGALAITVAGSSANLAKTADYGFFEQDEHDQKQTEAYIRTALGVVAGAVAGVMSILGGTALGYDLTNSHAPFYVGLIGYEAVQLAGLALDHMYESKAVV